MNPKHTPATQLTVAQAIALELVLAYIAVGKPIPGCEDLRLQVGAVCIAADGAL